MELTPVKSSNVAAVAYLAVDQVMLIRYHDGSLYARLVVTPSQYVAFAAASSKGEFVAMMPNRHMLISKGSRKGVADIEAKSGGAAEGQATAPLNVLDEEADKCCRRSLSG